MSASRGSVSLTDSSDDEEWIHSRKSLKKENANSSKRPRLENHLSEPEEGELPSDAYDDDEDDGLDDDLYGGDEDKQRLLKMSEREREEELYRRSERREAMKIRRVLKKRLKEKKEKEKAERANQRGSSPSKYSVDTTIRSPKKNSAYANVYSSDSDQESTSGDESGKAELRDRKLTLAMQKEVRSKRLQELADRRKEQKNKKETTISDSEDGRKDSRSRSKHDMRRRVYSSSSSDSDSSHSRRAHQTSRKRASVSSYSRSSSRSSESSDDARGRSRSPVEEYISSLDQISKIRLSRFKMERFVHMPFFDGLVKGCFVRIHIGMSQGVPMYRCGEIADVVEMSKSYDLGKTRTNKGLVIRIANEQHTYRVAFVSNSEILSGEFESWRKFCNKSGVKPPKISFVNEKAAEIAHAIVAPISDERVVEQIIQSKKRFQKAPTNFALRKAELLKQREVAHESGDTDKVSRLDMELEELETQAERIERRRTVGFKSINSINQRNRVLSVKHAEEAIIKDSKEAANSREEDPFMRIQSKPVIVTKSYLERLRNQRKERESGNLHYENEVDTLEKKEAEKLDSLVDLGLTNSPLSISTLPPPEESLHAIHDFEIDIKVELDSNGNHENLDGSSLHRSPGAALQGGSPSLATGGVSSHNIKPNRRFLNLQEYKRRRGLI